MDDKLTERRQNRRYQLDWSACIWHDATKRFYSAKSVDISATGALVRIPLSAPIRVAEKIEVNFTVPDGADPDQCASKVFSAKVVRVNRGQSILEAQQSIALQFV